MRQIHCLFQPPVPDRQVSPHVSLHEGAKKSLLQAGIPVQDLEERMLAIVA